MYTLKTVNSFLVRIINKLIIDMIKLLKCLKTYFKY